MGKVSSFFNRFFDLRPEDINKALLLQVFIFLLITSLLIVKPTVNSLFLTTLTSDALPTAYLLTAALAVVFSYFYDRILWRYPLIRVITWTLFSCAALLALFCLQLNYRPSSAFWLYLPYLFVAIFGLLTTSQFWILANMIFNVREAKRLFGFIGAGAIAGGISGGYLASFLTRFIPSPDLLLVAALMLLACVPISGYLWKHHVYWRKKATPEKTGHKVPPLRMIQKSRLLSLLTLTVGVSVVVAKMVDYQYSHFAAEKITEPDALTAFFGFWFSTLSIVSLLIQLLLTKRILKRFGLGKSLAFMPLGIFLGSLLLLLVPELWVVVIIKIVEGSFKQSLSKAATELVVLPVPIEVKKHTKPFIDIVVDSIATGLAGVILIFLINGLNVPSLYISYINLALVGIWLFLISRILRAYLSAFRELLVSEHPKAPRQKPAPIDASDASAYVIVERALESGSEGQVLFMLDRILEHPDDHYLPILRKLLGHNSPQVRAQAIRVLYYLKSEDLRPDMEGMLNDPSDEVVIASLRYLIHRDHDLHREEILQYEAHSSHKNIRALTLLAVAREVHTEPQLKQILRLGERVDQLLANLPEGDLDEKQRLDLIAVLEVIGHTQLESHYSIVQSCMTHPDTEVAEAALDAAAQIPDPQFTKAIVISLPDRKLRPKAIQVLSSLRAEAIPLLADLAESNTLPMEAAMFIPDVLKVMGTQEAVQALVRLVRSTEYAISIRALQALKELKDNQPELEIPREEVAGSILEECRTYQQMLGFLHAQLQLHQDEDLQHSEQIAEARRGLIHLLEHRVDGYLDRIFRLIGIHYYEKEVDPILHIIREGTDEERTNAIEFIDNILDARLRPVVLPIVDQASSGRSFSEDFLQSFNLSAFNEAECFETLTGRHDLRIKHAVLYLIEQLGNDAYIPLVKRLAQSPFETVRSQAEAVLKTLRQEENH